MNSVSHIILGTLLASGAALASEIDFDKHDKDGGGYLSKDEWRDIDQVVVDFERADANRDGRLDRDEVRNATSQSMEISATQQTGSDDEMQASVYSESGQHVEAERSGGGKSSGEQAGAEVASEEHMDAHKESTAGQRGEILRTTVDDGAGGHEPVRAQSVAQPETGRDTSQAGNEQEAEGRSGEEFREMDPARVDRADNASRSEMRPLRAGFDATGEGMQVFEEADTDGDGRISESEARLAGHDYVAIYFEQMDADSDGYLHQEEWDLTRREGMETRDVSTEERVQTMQGDDGEDLRYEGVGHERVGEDEEPDEKDDTDFER